MAKFDVLLAQAKFVQRFEGRIDKRVDIPRGICRFMFIEILFRIAKFLYSTYEAKTSHEVHMMRISDESHEEIKVAAAFYQFINKKLVPYYEKMKINQLAFRQHFLHHHEVEEVFTLNERPLKTIYHQKSQ